MVLNDIGQSVKQYILEEFLPGEDPKELNEQTPLIKGGILDSIATIKMVIFLEECFTIELSPGEVTFDNLNTIADIARLVEKKLKGAKA